jgi:hypothetical protein
VITRLSPVTPTLPALARRARQPSLRLKELLHRVAETLAGLVRLECPTVISRMSNGYDMIQRGIASTALA